MLNKYLVKTYVQQVRGQDDFNYHEYTSNGSNELV